MEQVFQITAVFVHQYETQYVASFFGILFLGLYYCSLHGKPCTCEATDAAISGYI